MSKLTETVEQLVLPILEDLGLELVDVEYVKEGKNWFLRIYIDKETGVDIEECGIVSERLGEKLDELDPIPHNYYLEVSSPGAERPLKKPRDFERAVGKQVHIKTYEPFDGQKVFEGILKSYDEDHLTVEYKMKNQTKTAVLPLKKVSSARLAVTFN